MIEYLLLSCHEQLKKKAFDQPNRRKSSVSLWIGLVVVMAGLLPVPVIRALQARPVLTLTESSATRFLIVEGSLMPPAIRDAAQGRSEGRNVSCHSIPRLPPRKNLPLLPGSGEV